MIGKLRGHQFRNLVVYKIALLCDVCLSCFDHSLLVVKKFASHITASDFTSGECQVSHYACCCTLITRILMPCEVEASVFFNGLWPGMYFIFRSAISFLPHKSSPCSNLRKNRVCENYFPEERALRLLKALVFGGVSVNTNIRDFCRTRCENAKNGMKAHVICYVSATYKYIKTQVTC
jgi:hypothetical protein